MTTRSTWLSCTFAFCLSAAGCSAGGADTDQIEGAETPAAQKGELRFVSRGEATLVGAPADKGALLEKAKVTAQDALEKDCASIARSARLEDGTRKEKPVAPPQATKDAAGADALQVRAAFEQTCVVRDRSEIDPTALVKALETDPWTGERNALVALGGDAAASAIVSRIEALASETNTLAPVVTEDAALRQKATNHVNHVVRLAELLSFLSVPPTTEAGLRAAQQTLATLRTGLSGTKWWGAGTAAFETVKRAAERLGRAKPGAWAD